MTKEELNRLLHTDITVSNYDFSDDLLVKTINFIKIAHTGQFDKMGFPYYTHPYRVCNLLKERFGNSSIYTPGQINYACILALLHDVCEDTEYTADDIAKHLELNEIQTNELKFGLSFITHDKDNMSYAEYIRKIAEGPLIYPVWVKFCDLLDNSSLDRIIVSNDSIFLTGEDMNRINKYLISLRILRKRINSQGVNFVCDDTEVNMINNFRTPAERKRMEKLTKKN